MDKNTSKTTRRSFIKSSSAAAVGGSLAFHIGMPSKAKGINSDTLKVGLIGCGGRGTGAANQALNADDNVVLTAMGDIFPDKMDKSLLSLKKENAAKVKVEKDHMFIGWDAYQKVLDSGVDVVILATPPAFRPDHLMAAVNAGKHIFCEKPMAVDAQGVRKVLDAARKAEEKDITLCSGFCWRFDFPKRATFSKILDGEIGEIKSIYNTYNTGALWSYPREEGWSDMEYKMRNWLYYNWLSGDHIAEQAIHSLDMMSWAMGDVLPVKAVGTGGRQRRVEELYGNVYDHFALVFEYPNGAKGFHFSRQQKDCTRAYHVEVAGTKGDALVDCIRRKHEIKNDKKWRYRGETNNMYQTEHDEIFASIREGKHFNEGVKMANSTMLAVMGRLVAYTGQEITWEEAMNSQEVLGPSIDKYSWELAWNDPAVAKPGITKFI